MKKKFSFSTKQLLNLESFFFLVAFELLMSFSFLGYIHIEPISVTISYIPVLIAACLLGPIYSTVLGAVFGIASLWKASAFYVSAGDRIFSPFLSGAPIQSFLLSVGSRLLFGAVVGVLYWAAKRSARHQYLFIAIISFFGKVLHSICVYGVMGIVFPEQGRGVLDAFEGFLDAGDLLVALFTMLLLAVSWKVWNMPQILQYRDFVRLKQSYSGSPSYIKLVVLSIVLLLIFAGMIGTYFVNRIRYMLLAHGVELSEKASHDLTHLQLQFLFGVIALSLIVYIVSRGVHDYIVYRVYSSMDKDGLTGLLNRKGFSRIYKNLSEKIEFSPEQPCYFMILDVDYFKEINDKYGHPQGDRILKEIANCLKETLGDIGIVGRLGGDEFLMFTHTPLPQELFEERVRCLMDKIQGIECDGEKKISCSIGIVSAWELASEEFLYHYADQALYRAKGGGRNQYVITAVKKRVLK